MQYVGLIKGKETQAVERMHYEEDDAWPVVVDETFTVMLDQWICPKGHEYTEYPFFRAV